MFKGIFTALITPFKEDATLDLEKLEFLIEKQIQAGIDGLVVLGTTAETPTLTLEEKQTVFQLAREKTRGKLSLIAGTGSNCTRTSIEMTRWAEAHGADGALIVTPYYNKPTQEGLVYHFNAIANATKLPLMLYNIPGRTGVAIELETLMEIARHENIVAIKEASGNLDKIMEAMLHLPELRFFSGDDALNFPLFALGASGSVSVLSNVEPEKVKKIFTLINENQLQEARRLHFELMPLCRALFCETNPIAVKYALNAGPCRLPLTALSEKNRERLDALLAVGVS